mmetsp:Transcript_12592/g.16183  ORF Transcript_12592/g.16183 Transcript_12592/m.16183 type:complete len:219 (+) Transcript_12592:2627-3283(+)
MGARSAHLVTFATAPPTRPDRLSSKTIVVRDAPRDTTAPWAASSHSSASLVATILSKAWKQSQIADCARRELSRTSGAKKAAKCAANSLTLSRGRTSASASATTGPTRQRTPPAAARVATTTSMSPTSPRAMSVISLIASLWFSRTVDSMARQERDNPMALVSPSMTALRHAQESLARDLPCSVSAPAIRPSPSMQSATRTAEERPLRWASRALIRLC